MLDWQSPHVALRKSSTAETVDLRRQRRDVSAVRRLFTMLHT